MITSIKITDNNRTPFRYLPDVDAFKNDTEYKFIPGVNVIIGRNGCGKSTLLNLIAMYTFCTDTMSSAVPNVALSFPCIWDDKDRVFDGIEIHADYVGKVFRMLPHMEMKKDDILGNMENFTSYVNGTDCSSGEKGIVALNSLFKSMFSTKDYAFPIAELRERSKGYSEMWRRKIDNLIQYYKKNHIKVDKESFEYTVLMDEPDRNLDVQNIMEVYEVLSFHKPQTQIIAVIHNPALIYKLSKLDCVNFVEMTKGYLNEILNFIKD